MRLYKSNIKFTDSFNTPIKIKEGYWFKRHLKENNMVTDDQVRRLLNRFKNGDFGEETEFDKPRNDEAKRTGKGYIVGVYPLGRDAFDDLIIFYDDKKDEIYLLSRYDYENHPIAWEGKVVDPHNPEKITYDPENDIRGNKVSTNPMRRYNLSQRYHIITQAQKDLGRSKGNAAAASYYKIGINKEDPQVQTALETLESRGLLDRIKKVAENKNVSLEDALEKIMEYYLGQHLNLENSVDRLERNQDKPNYWADSLKKKELIVEVDPSTNNFEVQSNGYNAAGKVDDKGLAHTFAEILHVEPKQVREEYICEMDGYKYYKVTVDMIIKDSKCKDMFEPISTFKTFEFIDKTRQGFDVVTKYEDLDDGRMHVIAHRPSDDTYIVCVGYNADDGTWNQGYYDFKDPRTAENFLKRKYKVDMFFTEDELRDFDEAINDEEMEDIFIEDKGMRLGSDGLKEMMELSDKLGIKTYADLEKFCKENGLKEVNDGQAVLEALRKAAKPEVKDECKDSEEKPFIICFEGEHDFDTFDDTDLVDLKPLYVEKNDISSQPEIMEYLKKVAHELTKQYKPQIINSGEHEFEVLFEMVYFANADDHGYINSVFNKPIKIKIRLK